MHADRPPPRIATPSDRTFTDDDRDELGIHIRPHCHSGRPRASGATARRRTLPRGVGRYRGATVADRRGPAGAGRGRPALTRGDRRYCGATGADRGATGAGRGASALAAGRRAPCDRVRPMCSGRTLRVVQPARPDRPRTGDRGSRAQATRPDRRPEPDVPAETRRPSAERHRRYRTLERSPIARRDRPRHLAEDPDCSSSNRAGTPPLEPITLMRERTFHPRPGCTQSEYARHRRAPGLSGYASSESRSSCGRVCAPRRPRRSLPCEYPTCRGGRS